MNNINCVLGISSLYNKLPGYFIEKFLTVEQKRFDRYIPLDKDTIFHSDMFLVDEDFLGSLDKLGAFDMIARYHIRRFSFDIGTCFKKVKVIDNKFFGLGRRLSLKEIYELCEKKIDCLRRRLPRFCEIAVENSNYYDTGAYEDVCEPAFYRDIHKKFGLGLVFDIAHARVSAINKKTDLHQYLEGFDSSAMSEFHISKAKLIAKDQAVDFHEVPDTEEFQILWEIVRKRKGKCDVVIEYWKNADAVIDAYKKMEEFFDEKDKNHTAA